MSVYYRKAPLAKRGEEASPGSHSTSVTVLGRVFWSQTWWASYHQLLVYQRLRVEGLLPPFLREHVYQTGNSLDQRLEVHPPFTAVIRHQEFGFQSRTLRSHGVHLWGKVMCGHDALGIRILQSVENVFGLHLGGPWNEGNPWGWEIYYLFHFLVHSHGLQAWLICIKVS